jgi:hypothetical protein
VTVIAALADGHTVWMAADTATNYQGTYVPSSRKIIRVEFPNDGAQVLLAASGDGGILPVAARIIRGTGAGDDPHPLNPSNWEDLDVWATEVAETITRGLADVTPPLTCSRGEGSSPGMDGAFLLAHAGRLWYLFTHQANRVTDGIAVLGAGADYALGYLECATDWPHEENIPPERIVRDAVAATCTRIPYCHAPNGPLVEVLTMSDAEVLANA